MAEKMKMYPWLVVEEPYQPERNVVWETLFTLGNGYLGSRGVLEEAFHEPQESYPGNYLAGVYDTFEEHYVELVNIPEFFNMKIKIGKDILDLRDGKLSEYKRTLDMKQATLTRTFVWEKSGRKTRFYFQRFISMDNVHAACQRIRITPLNHKSQISIETGLNGDVFNRKQRDWPYLKEIVPLYHLDLIGSGKQGKYTNWLHTRTKKKNVDIVQASAIKLMTSASVETEKTGLRITQSITLKPKKGQETGLDRFFSIYTSRDIKLSRLKNETLANLRKMLKTGYEHLFADNKSEWDKKWKQSDIVIGGDNGAQQGIRFNIFHLMQANSRKDPMVNIPAKLLSHTRYKGCCFWDTEIFMFPFFVYEDPEAARNLLMYRYNMLPAARQNAADQWCEGARYPFMSADDGSNQCSNWEYGDCEVHITADVAYAVNHYLQATDDMEFLIDYGAEILIETSRYWVGRVAWSKDKQKYTILSVKGPDEYCAITNNNQYTNYMVCHNLEIAGNAVKYMQKHAPEKWAKLQARIKYKASELKQWNSIKEKMYFNWDRKADLLIQDDTFLDKPEEDLSKYAGRKQPLCEIMPIERLMRVRLLRQTDVVLLMFLLGNYFTQKQKAVAYDYYEAITTHDSSLSYNTHSVMAAELRRKEKAYHYFTKTCRLDLDDELNTAKHGIHGASLGGTWQSVVMGFGGVKIKNGKLNLDPLLPDQWEKLAFKIQFRGRIIAIEITHCGIAVNLLSGDPLAVIINGEEKKLREHNTA